MKLISPGVVALRPIKLVVDTLTQDMVDWWVMQGANAEEITDQYYGRKGPTTSKYYRIKPPGSKWSHMFNDGSGIHLIHLNEQYASTATLFMLKFPDTVISHNIEVPNPQLD